MRIKKHKRNQYILAEGIWVRNPYSNIDPTDINNLSKADIGLFIENETHNLKAKAISSDDLATTTLDNVIICSDGYGWKELHKVLAEVPNKKAKVFGINGTLARWELVGELSGGKKRVMSYYLANNPYEECRYYLPQRHKYYPPLIASVRTNPEFINGYLERPIFYFPTKDLSYSGIPRDGCMTLDEYRNPLCAAVSYCAKMGAKKMILFCCDEAFEDERPGAERMMNGLYQYPQQIKSQRIVDAQLYWLKSNGVKVADCSSGVEYQNAAYIQPDQIQSFLDNE